MNLTNLLLLLFCRIVLSNAFVALRQNYIFPSVCNHQSQYSTNLLLSSDEENYDDDEDEDDEPPEVDVSNFQPPNMKANFGRGRSSPSQRKAMGTSGKSTTKVFVCTNCGSESVQWLGRCPTCRSWNTLQEMAVRRAPNNTPQPMFSSAGMSSTGWLDGVGVEDDGRRPISISKVDFTNEKQRLVIPQDDEWNTVLGGGLLKGSLILLGGDPGVGKSTLALQVAANLAQTSTPPVGIGMGQPSKSASSNGDEVGPVWYVSGEETLTQIAIRAQRLGTISSQLFLLAETNLNAMAEQVVQLVYHPAINSDIDVPSDLPPSLIVIDSIQTMMCEAGGQSSPGGIVQVRECMALLLRLAKSTKIPILVIGHVTKSGDVAGPRMVEHMVDAVLYLESTTSQQQRWLRASKNRFGSCQNVGLYEFKSGKLVPTPPDADTTSLSASSLVEDLEGCAMAISLEGPYRALTSEVQALVTASSSSFGKKTVDGGFSHSRLQLLLGVLQKHCSVFIGKSRDVYLNVVSGASTTKQGATALDLAVAVAVTSSLVSIPVRGDTVFLAQVGLLGELRPLSSLEPRLMQAQRMGVSRVIVAGRKLRIKRHQEFTEYIECPTLKQALEYGLTASIPKRKSRRKQQQGSSLSSSGKKQPSPGSLNELELENVIVDDGDDEDDYYY